jgi:phosphoserine phosphatase
MANLLFVFDMDGTLLIRTTACIEIAKVSGTLDELHILEQRFAAGEIDAFCFAQNIGALWGMVDERVVRAAFEELAQNGARRETVPGRFDGARRTLCAFEATPKLNNIKAVTTLIRRAGGKSGLITMSPDFYAKLFYEYGFDFIAASQFPRSSHEEVKREHILSPQDKATIVQGWCRRLGFELNQCVAFGDSMSDYLLFKELEHTVSINGDATLRDLARYHYEGSDLQEALLIICDALTKS